MNKNLILLVITALLFNCSTQQQLKFEPTLSESASSSQKKGKWIWYNQTLNNKVQEKSLSIEELNHALILSENKCKIESLKIQIPSPSCSTIPAPNCSGLTGFALGYCRSQKPSQTCDRSSVDIAKNAQNEILESCMKLEGWEEIWKTNEDLISSISNENSLRNTVAVQHIIDSIPELLRWQYSDLQKFNLAISIDEHIKELPDYKNIAIRDRFLIVVDKVNKLNQ